jgi:hypothetical protein
VVTLAVLPAPAVVVTVGVDEIAIGTVVGVLTEVRVVTLVMMQTVMIAVMVAVSAVVVAVMADVIARLTVAMVTARDAGHCDGRMGPGAVVDVVDAWALVPWW